MLGTTPKTSFADNLNTRFRATGNDTAFDLELIEIIDGRSTQRQEQFSLVFRATQDAPVQQGTYHMEWKEGGSEILQVEGKSRTK